jgi:hypothetical protein
MHDQPRPRSVEAEDEIDVRNVFTHVVTAQPGTLRFSDLILELGDPEEFSERDRIERAVRELVRAGLVFRVAEVVLPTRAALRAYELLIGSSR